MTDPNDVTLADTEDFLKVCYYGEAKRGKTTYMAGAARLGKIFVIDTEGAGWLNRPLKAQGVPTENIIYRKATTYNEMEDHFDEVHKRLKDGEPIVATCIDHMSDLEQRFIRAATMSRQTKKMNLGRAVEFRSAQALIDAGVNPFVTELADFGVWTNQARHLMRLYRDLDCHVAFGAHMRTERGQRVPGLTEKFREELMGSLNLIVGCDLEQLGPNDEDLYHVGVAREIDGWRGGDRMGITRPRTINPSFDRLISASQGKLDFSTDEQQKKYRDLKLNGN